MKFKKLTLYTNKFEEEYNFYYNILGFKNIVKDDLSFTVQIGWRKLLLKILKPIINIIIAF